MASSGMSTGQWHLERKTLPTSRERPLGLMKAQCQSPTSIRFRETSRPINSKIAGMMQRGRTAAKAPPRDLAKDSTPKTSSVLQYLPLGKFTSTIANPAAADISKYRSQHYDERMGPPPSPICPWQGGLADFTAAAIWRQRRVLAQEPSTLAALLRLPVRVQRFCYRASICNETMSGESTVALKHRRGNQRAQDGDTRAIRSETSHRRPQKEFTSMIS